MHLYVAEVSAADRSKHGGGNPHEGENIEVVEVPLPTLYEMAGRGEIEDAKTLIIVQRLMLEELVARTSERDQGEAWLTCARCAPLAGAASSD